MAPSSKALETCLKEATHQLYAADPNAVTVNSVRQRVEEENDLAKGFFVTPEWKARSKVLITEFVVSGYRLQTLVRTAGLTKTCTARIASE